MPSDQQERAHGQVVHFFHVCVVLDVLEWLTCLYQDDQSSLRWLAAFFKKSYGERLLLTNLRELTARHLRSFFTTDLEQARLQTGYRQDDWALQRLDFLELLATEIHQNVRGTQGRPMYCFLDDYSTPLVTETTQRILNAVVFRRSSKVIFKIATESVESIELEGLHGKTLEQEDDFLLVDTGTEILQRSTAANRKTITTILQPRISRDARLSEHRLSVANIVGRTPYKNTDLARQLRSAKGDKKTRVLYHGTQVFCDLWSSNTREMITLFAELVGAVDPTRLLNERIRQSGPLVQPDDQDKLIRSAGSRFRDLLVSATNPTRKLYELSGKDDPTASIYRRSPMPSMSLQTTSFRRRTPRTAPTTLRSRPGALRSQM